VAPAPQLVGEQAKTQVMQQTLNRSRDEDKAPAETPPSPAIGVAPSFNSAEATQRLAAMTGAGTWPPPLEGRQSATQAVSALPRPANTGWRRRDWLLVGGAAVLGLIAAGVIVKRD